MSVLFDSCSGNGGYPPIGISFSHYLGNNIGTNRIVLLGIQVRGSNPVVTGCTYNGSSMSLITTVQNDYYSAITRTFVYMLLDANLPSSSGSYTVSATISDAYDGRVCAYSATGVSQITPPYSSSNNWTNPAYNTVAYTTNRTVVSSYGLLVDIGAADSVSATNQADGSGQTERNDGLYNSCLLTVSEKSFSSSGSNSMSHTPNGTYNAFCHVIIELASSEGIENACVIGSNF